MAKQEVEELLMNRRALLERLEANPDKDPELAEFVRNSIRTIESAIESARESILVARQRSISEKVGVAVTCKVADYAKSQLAGVRHLR